MLNSLFERLRVSIDRDWLIAQIEAVEGLSSKQRIAAGKCLGRFDGAAWSTEEAAFLGGLPHCSTKEAVTQALDRCVQNAPNEGVRTELNRIGNWLFPVESELPDGLDDFYPSDLVS